MKQKEQTELLRTQQMLNEVNRKLLMTLGVAEVFPWKWELAERMVWFDARPSDDPEGWEIFIMTCSRFLLRVFTRAYTRKIASVWSGPVANC